MTKLRAVPLTLKAANKFIDEYHRHNKPVIGLRFAIGVKFNDEIVGVGICGRPVSRVMDDGLTAEITRCCVLETAPKGACSFIYACLWRAWKSLGGTKMITYTLQRESGSSLKGLKDMGWKCVQELEPRDKAGWTNRGKGRLIQEVVGEPKLRWEIVSEPAVADDRITT